jgi:uridylate kinase
MLATVINGMALQGALEEKRNENPFANGLKNGIYR